MKTLNKAFGDKETPHQPLGTFSKSGRAALRSILLDCSHIVNLFREDLVPLLLYCQNLNFV